MYFTTLVHEAYLRWRSTSIYCQIKPPVGESEYSLVNSIRVGMIGHSIQCDIYLSVASFLFWLYEDETYFLLMGYEAYKSNFFSYSSSSLNDGKGKVSGEKASSFKSDLSYVAGGYVKVFLLISFSNSDRCFNRTPYGHLDLARKDWRVAWKCASCGERLSCQPKGACDEAKNTGMGGRAAQWPFSWRETSSVWDLIPTP